MSSFVFGIAAALAAPLVMTIGFLVWEDHWHGSAFALNLFKCNLASVVFVILSTTTRRGNLFPSDVFTSENVGFLMLSATIGIVIGDWTWLKGLKVLGARRVILLDSLKPFLAAFFGWILLGEDLQPAAFGGIVLTVVGILIVSFEKTPPQDEDDQGAQGGAPQSSQSFAASNESQLETADLSLEDPSAALSSVTDVRDDEEEEKGVASESVADHNVQKRGGKRWKRQRTPKEIRVGYSMSILNVLLDTYGAVLIKQYGQGMTVWEINLIRFGFSGAVMLCLSLSLSARAKLSPSAVKDDDDSRIPWYQLPIERMSVSSWVHVTIGVLLVTVLTPSLSNYALFQIAIALALTLGSIGPLYSIPLSFLIQKEVPTVRACAGAVLVVAGVVVLAFKGSLPAGES